MSLVFAYIAAASASPDACALLEPREIAAVQGEAPRETKASSRAEGALLVSDCVFVLPLFSKSISLEVARGAKGEARRRWREIFHSPRGERSEGAEEKERVEPSPVPGVGDEAFWIGDRPTSAFYVLRKDAFVRISIGGPDPRDVKLARARKLVRKILRRL